MSHSLVLVRHGETEWSATGKHTGLTDVDLTETGERQARALEPVLAAYQGCPAWSSPLQRARRTAELAGLGDVTVDRDLLEWDYGAYEGRTTEEISHEIGKPWSIWQDGVEAAGGESLASLAGRAARVLARATPLVAAGGDVALVGHGHALRVLAATWLGLDPAAASLLALSPGSVSALGFEHDRHVLARWNVRPSDVVPHLG